MPNSVIPPGKDHVTVFFDNKEDFYEYQRARKVYHEHDGYRLQKDFTAEIKANPDSEIEDSANKIPGKSFMQGIYNK